MDIIIKTVRGIALTNLIVLGLASCSSTPAPWAQADNSPWGSKHANEAQNSAVNESMADTSLNDPVLLADPEPEPIAMQEPEAMAAPEVIVPVIVEEPEMEQTAEQEIMVLSAAHYAVQAYAGNTVESVEKFKMNTDLGDLKTVKTDRSGTIVYVLVDVYPDRATANAAAKDIEMKSGSTPWVRSVAGLQKIVAQ